MIATKKNIFLADDDADDREMFEEALREVSNDLNILIAGDGRELMSMLEEKVPPPPDVIFLDLNMPIKNGFECLAEIREVQKLKNIPVIIYSTSCEKEFIDRVYKCGADYYICKPNNFQMMKEVLLRAISIDWQQHVAQPSREEFILA